MVPELAASASPKLAGNAHSLSASQVSEPKILEVGPASCVFTSPPSDCDEV